MSTTYTARKILFFAALVALAFPLATNAQATTNARDSAIYQAARHAAAPYDIFFNNIRVAVKDGVVTLRGQVESQRQAQHIEEDILVISGVSKVNNSLRPHVR